MNKIDYKTQRIYNVKVVRNNRLVELHMHDINTTEGCIWIVLDQPYVKYDGSRTRTEYMKVI